jgi:hypothetical protein
METIVLHTMQMETAKLILKFLGKTVSVYSILLRPTAIHQTTIQGHLTAAALQYIISLVIVQPAIALAAKHATPST